MVRKKASKLDILIVGAGGFGREVYHWAKDTYPKDAYNIKGYIAKNTDTVEGRLVLPVLGDEMTYTIKENDRFLLAIGKAGIKKDIVLRLKEKGAQFISLIHPTAIVADSAKIGEGVILCPFVTICDRVILEDFVMMNIYASCGHDVRVGKYSILSPYATVNGEAILEEDVFLGSHSTVRLGKRIGQKSKVSANSSVMQDVPERALVAGVPGVATVIY